MRGIYGIEYRGNVVYVGCSANISRRWGQHRCTLANKTHRNFLLQRIYNKSPGGLTFRVLEVVESGDLAEPEQRWMDEIRPYTNISDSRGSHPHTDEAKAKMRAYVRTEAHRQKISAALRGKPSANRGVTGYRHTPEAIEKIRAAGTGRTCSEQERVRRSESQKGRVFTPEHREKLAAAKRGKPQAESGRVALIGRKQSPETIAKRVASCRRTLDAQREAASNGE